MRSEMPPHLDTGTTRFAAPPANHATGKRERRERCHEMGLSAPKMGLCAGGHATATMAGIVMSLRPTLAALTREAVWTPC
ncbi:Os08g0428051 [Oryza sativa Japonica Group]|uniref:Os08g0428051 protein n=1 Tax=Oryza sativa subsp. japonica TaxID=39947 RepID=A0A0P0XG28_ORYSJ|nr:Os08g0428051 [Oryza sativa Japonica Group]